MTPRELAALAAAAPSVKAAKCCGGTRRAGFPRTPSAGRTS